MAEKKEGRVERWDPFRELRQMEPWAPFRDLGWAPFRLSRLMEDLFGEAPRGVGMTGPAIDVTEADDHYLVTAEVPGVRQQDLTLEVHEGVLSLRGEKKSEREETQEKARWLERSYGSFSRSFTLPPDADPERIEARYDQGVLKVRIAKAPHAKPKLVAIKS